MALTPQAMMNLRRGPTAGPTPNPGGAPPPGAGPPGAGMPATPGAETPGNMLMTAIADRMNQAKKTNANFATANIDQLLRVIGSMQIHIAEMHPDAARHLNRAWGSLDQAKKALNEAVKDAAVPTGPPLGFSGAAMGPTPAGGPPGMGNGGGGMGVPS